MRAPRPISATILGFPALAMDTSRKPELWLKMRLVPGPPIDPHRRATARPILGFVGRDLYLTVGQSPTGKGDGLAGAKEDALQMAVKLAVPA